MPKPKFAHRHYEWIAGDIREQLDTCAKGEHRWQALSDLANHMADGFIQDSPNFNRERFLKACGVITN